MNQYYEHHLSSFVFQAKDLPGTLSYSSILIFSGCLVALYFVGRRILPFILKPTQLHSLFSIFIGYLSSLILAGYALKSAGNGELGLRWYSAMYLAAFLFCYIMMRYWIHKKSIMLTKQLLDQLITWLIVGMIVGARLAYVFVYHWDIYKISPLEIFEVWGGGLSFHGGIVGVVVAIYFFCRRHKISFWHLADRISYTVPFGIGMGRIGNFINGELYGRVIQSDVPWAVVFPAGGPQPRHPSQIYQSLGEGWLLFIVLIVLGHRKPGRKPDRKPYREGLIAVSFIGFYGFFRYFIEFYREADEQLQYYFGDTTTMGQILCVLTMIIAIGLYYFFVSNNICVGTNEWQNRNKFFLDSHQSL